ncbi:MAG: cytochrome c4 [Betaproteobacteria bacterium]|nr:MAG: cytochrome c4 [Betaproteobacteria bacterium]
MSCQFAVFAAPVADVEAGKKLAEQVCTACHGEEKTLNSETPILAGQTWRYLYLQMKDFQRGRRTNELMSPLMKDLSRQDMVNLAAYYSQQTFRGQNERGSAALIDAGRKIADDALCTMCHLGGFKGQNEVPRVAGQHYSYIVKQLVAFKNRERTNDAGTMTAYMSNVTREQMEAVAAYVANLQTR